ncbi:OFA family MFS transporter [Bifidobacterium pullorum subsp. saeculare]|uniref:OFA family MFS transporter n=1 Tax=Bifidobacterium pullorum subsp. saeculare TaxID=78257 RepID=A0A939B988_9BIFI|nr:OFA family MFS transporter [Bifidobacterium pullorum]MBM6699244.1 OFA family MFS transporter [Bifidobacterium pullorum subsp. saeculare]
MTITTRIAIAAQARATRSARGRWAHAVAPALLIHVSIGTVYCWSVFKQDIANAMQVPAGTVEWAFSLAIFFLGMSAACLGPLVERDIRKSALISAICFVVGFAGTGASIAAGWLPGVFLCYGAVMGVGLGIGYLTPVKNLMLWFADNKGLATGIAVAGFGLAKAIASPVMQWLIDTVGLTGMFLTLSAVYAVMMLLGFALIRRPDGYVYHPEARIRRRTVVTRPLFWAIWLAFYLNITCGLALISQEKDMLHDVLALTPRYAGLDAIHLAAATAGVIATVLAADAVFNAAGRIGFSTLSDHCRRRETAYVTIFALSIAVCMAVAATGAIAHGALWLVLAMLFLVNAGYGGGFSTLPVLLEQHFGMSSVSAVHGLALSAWAMAGLSGNQLASFVVSHAADPSQRYAALIPVLAVLYAVALAAVLAVVRAGRRRPSASKQVR